jgi:hypothetical protein
VAGLHYVQITDDRELSPLRLKCIQSVRDVMQAGDTYEMITVPSVNSVTQQTSVADRVRADKAMTCPNMVYVDTDCFLTRRFEPAANGNPWLALYEFSKAESFPDMYYFFVNDRCDYFKEHFSKPLNDGVTYGLPAGMLSSLRGYSIIPEMSYVHCYLTTAYNVGGVEALQNYTGKKNDVSRNLFTALYENTTRQSALILKLAEQAGAI